MEETQDGMDNVLYPTWNINFYSLQEVESQLFHLFMWYNIINLQTRFSILQTKLDFFKTISLKFKKNSFSTEQDLCFLEPKFFLLQLVTFYISFSYG